MKYLAAVLKIQNEVLNGSHLDSPTEVQSIGVDSAVPFGLTISQHQRTSRGSRFKSGESFLFCQSEELLVSGNVRQSYFKLSRTIEAHEIWLKFN